MKLTHLVPLAVLTAGLAGCGKPDPESVKLAVKTSIYNDRSFFDQVCGFPLDIMYQATTQVEVSDIDAKKRPSGDAGAPATAKLHLSQVHKKGAKEEQTCEAKVSFTWGVKSKFVTDRRHKQGETSEWYEAWDFKKL